MPAVFVHGNPETSEVWDGLRSQPHRWAQVWQTPTAGEAWVENTLPPHCGSGRPSSSGWACLATSRRGWQACLTRGWASRCSPSTGRLWTSRRPGHPALNTSKRLAWRSSLPPTRSGTMSCSAQRPEGPRPNRRAGRSRPLVDAAEPRPGCARAGGVLGFARLLRFVQRTQVHRARVVSPQQTSAMRVPLARWRPTWRTRGWAPPRRRACRTRRACRCRHR